VRRRRVIPQTISYFARPGYGYQPGWFLTGVDVVKLEHRIFRLSHIVHDGEGDHWMRLIPEVTT
jgi:hypothetical protein